MTLGTEWMPSPAAGWKRIWFGHRMLGDFPALCRWDFFWRQTVGPGGADYISVGARRRDVWVELSGRTDSAMLWFLKLHPDHADYLLKESILEILREVTRAKEISWKETGF